MSQPSFYETFEAHAERRTAVLETLVQPDLQRWRRLKEKRRRSFGKKKMLTSLNTIVTELKAIGQRQEKIMEMLEKSTVQKNLSKRMLNTSFIDLTFCHTK